MGGKHKIGIIGTTKECNGKMKRHFIGIMSSFNYTVHRAKYRNNYNREGEMFILNGLNGKQTLVQNESALRKFEILQLKIDWLTMKMIFKRCDTEQSSKDIVLNLNRKD